jgi:hypothetical protein
MFTRSARIPLAIAIFSLIILACAVTSAPVAPTRVPGAAETFVAQTVEAWQNEIALSQPPPTATATQPTNTPTARPVTATPTDTPVPILPTLAPPMPTSTETGTPTQTVSTNPADYQCLITSTYPSKNETLAARQDVDMRWVVRNIGNTTWYADSMIYSYQSGAKINKRDSYKLPYDVAVGQEVSLVIDAITPQNKGEYSLTWRLSVKSVSFCNLQLEFKVE